MKKHLLILTISIIALTLSSCSLIASLSSRTKQLNEIDKSDREIAENRLLEILEALENKDGEALKNMLSEEALSEAEDIDENIEYALDYYKGTHINYEIEIPQSGGKYDNGKRTEYHISGTFKVMTEIDTYLIALDEIIICDDNIEKVGITALQIVRDLEKKSWIGDLGIYVLTKR